MSILHLTDLHLLDERGLHYNSVATSSHLEAVLDDASRGGRCRAIVVSGDISEDGSLGSYRFAKAAIGELAGQWNAPVVWGAGNHDKRGPMREGLGLPGQGLSPMEFYADIGELRIVVADSTVLGSAWGRIGQRLDGLRTVLSGPCELPVGRRHTLLVIHHPLAPPPTVLHSALALDDAPQVAAMLSELETPPEAILSGHYHMPMMAGAAGIPVVVGAAVANETSRDRGTSWEAAVVKAGYGVVTFGEDGIHARSIQVSVEGEGTEIFSYPPATVDRMARDGGRPGWEPRTGLGWHGEGYEHLS